MSDERQPPSSEEATEVFKSRRGLSAQLEPHRLPTPGQRLVERYTVLQVLGEGGMGVVLAAYDERLDRRVALKLMRQGNSDGSELQARLVREAQAMARLNHPNVVAVYDSGQLEDHTFFIAMEYVEGKTLKEWCQQQRPWREVLAAYLEAGRGLVAAHAVGLIHRDFKPANVLVGHDGRVRVTDFGVARADSSYMTLTPRTPMLLSPAAWETPLTLPGNVVGTPKYLAPELFQGQPADARSDLFAFCVALYEALYGQSPFRGSSTAERMQAQKEGQLNPPPARTEVPAWVGRAVAQGLRAEPGQRPASMQALIAILEDDPEERLRERLRAGALVGGALALVGLAAWGWARGQGQGCEATERRLAGVWDGAMRAQVREALLGTGLSYSASTAQRVERELDSYAGAWVRMSREVCEAAATGPEQGRGLVVLREACLARRRSQLLALTELLAKGPDPVLVPKAVQAAQALPLLAYCADDRALLAAVPPPEEPGLRARVEELQQQVDRLEALYEAGKYAEGLARAQQVLAAVEGVDFAPLQAQALYQVARLQDRAGEYKSAEARVREAIALAGRGGDVLVLARAWSLLTSLVGDRQRRPQEALGLELTLESVVDLARDDQVRASAHNNLGNVLYAMGRYGESLARHERALALREKALGPAHPEVAGSLNNLGNALQALGRYQEAQARYERALELWEKALGPEHPLVTLPLNNLGLILASQGRYREALAYDERALALRERVLGPEHPDVAMSLNNMGSVLEALGKHQQAREHHERALALRERALGPEHSLVATSLINLGGVLHALGLHEQALARHERARALLEKALGPEHHWVATALTNQGRALQALGRHGEAQARYARALALSEKVLGANHPDVANPLLRLGELYLAQRRLAQATALLERALTLAHTQLRAEVQLSLAQALWDSGGDRRRAVRLATQAHEQWLDWQHPRQAEAAQWLATHALP